MANKKFDAILLVVVLTLIGIGIVMVYEASSAVAEVRYGDSALFLKNHLLRVLIGGVLMGIFSRIRYRGLLKFYLFFLCPAFVFLILLLISSHVVEVNGAKRWFEFHGISFQPAELMKFALILYLAQVLIKKREKLHDFTRGPLPQFIILSIAIGLIAFQPHMGAIVIILLICVVMFLVAGTRISHLMLYGFSTLPLVALTFLINRYQWQRLQQYFDALRKGQPQGYQIKQSLISLGSGGLWGVGLGNSKQKLFFLPEPYQDFIFAILGEVWGFLGVTFVLTLFLILMWRGLKIAAKAPDERGTLLAIGITAMIMINVFLNVGVVSNLLPITGLPLPFISYGGTSLIINMAGVGVLLNISARQKTPPRGYRRIL